MKALTLLLLFILISVFPAGGGTSWKHRGAFTPTGGPARREEPRTGKGEDWVGAMTPKENGDAECVTD